MNSNTAGEAPIMLLVEDNDAHAEMVRRSFEQHEIPNCILMDLRLPKVDGLEVLRRLNQPLPRGFPSILERGFLSFKLNHG